MASWTTPKTVSANTLATAADWNTYVRDNTQFLYDELTGTFASFKRNRMFHREALVTAGNAHKHYVSSSQPFCTFSGFNHSAVGDAANGDTWTNGCWLSEGTYTFHVLGVEHSQAGKIDWTIDGGTIVTGQDWYDGDGYVYNIVKSTTNITVETTGWHVIQGTINGKNASSSGYLHMLTAYWFTPSAD